MSGRRSFVVLVFALLLGVSLIVSGCSKSGNPVSPSSGTPTVSAITKTALSIGNVVPVAPTGSSFVRGDLVSVDVSWKITTEDWASSTSPTVFVCVSQDENTTFTTGCHGKGLSGREGSLQGVYATVPNDAAGKTVRETNYIQVYLTRTWYLDPYMESLDVQNILHFPFSRIAPVLIGDPTPVARVITWVSPN